MAESAIPTSQRVRPPASPGRWLPLGLLAALTLALLIVVLRLHSVPGYGPETDLLGDLIPAARSLRAGQILAANFEYKGPGYPALLAGAGAALRGDDWLAARLLNVLAAAAGAWFAFLLATRFLSAGAGLFVMLGLFASPVWLRAAIEAGTDMPAFAISIAATWLVIARRRRASWALAGLVAGLGYLTRYNAVSLLPAAAIVGLMARPRREGSTAAGERATSGWLLLAAYVAGFGVIVGGWTLVSRVFGSGVPRNLNYLNVAFEIYGRGMMWDNYWTTAAVQFHSLLDVLRFDPMRVAQVLSRNVGIRWVADIQQLVPVWIGVPAIAGMLIVWPRRPGSLQLAAHALCAYLVLSGVFYSPRFFLYLVPFYLMGAAALLFHLPPVSLRAQGKAPPPAREPRSAVHSRRPARTGTPARAGQSVRPQRHGRTLTVPAWLSWALAAGALVASGGVAITDAGHLMSLNPYETQRAGELLKRLGPPGARVMARKPHAPYFAGMEYVPMPQVETFAELMAYARDRRPDYLVFTPVEASLRGQFLLLADSGVVLPGLQQITRQVYTPSRFFALYRFTHEAVDSVAFPRALLEQAVNYARKNGRNPSIQTYVGGLLLDYGQPEGALKLLNWSYRLDPGNSQTAGLAALAYFDVGDFVQAGAAAERAIARAPASAPIHALVGLARASEGRWAEARDIFERASGLEPTDPRPLLMVAIACLATGDAVEGRRVFDRCVAISPALAPFRDRTLAAFAAGPSNERALELVRLVMNSIVHQARL